MNDTNKTKWKLKLIKKACNFVMAESKQFFEARNCTLGYEKSIALLGYEKSSAFLWEVLLRQANTPTENEAAGRGIFISFNLASRS